MSGPRASANPAPFAAYFHRPNASRSFANFRPVNRTQLEHIIRAAAGVSDANEIVIIGSQAILGTHPDAPAELLDSMEADVFPRDRPADSILIDGAIGETSIFHETFGYYAHGVDETTAVLPHGWQDRLRPIRNENTRGATGWCLEVHDLAVSKLIAGREKDLAYLVALFRYRLATPTIVQERLEETPLPSVETHQSAIARLQRLVSR